MKVRSFFKNHLVFGVFLALSLVVAGCGGGSDSYDSPESATNAPIQGAETNVLIEPATLKSWIDEGLVNSEDPFKQRVVIIDYGSYDVPVSEDDRPRIQGACMVAKSALVQTRTEGVAAATPLVATGDQMDAVIQNFGIDEDTIIVFTSSTSPYFASRAYWTFRYWGFSKEQLRLLNGGNSAFDAAYPNYMATEGVEATPSNFSVRDLPAVNTELRASIGELIEIIKGLPNDDNNVVIDARGDAYYLGNKATSALLEGDFVVVDGHPVGGEYLSFTSLLKDYPNDTSYKSAAEIRALFEEKGWAPGKKVTVYCTSAYSATPLFFALDAILDTDVQLHDGSWSQTGKYSDYSVMGGQLPAGSPWAIDDYLDAATVNYNMGTPDPLAIETLQLVPEEAQDAPFTGDNPADDSDVNPAGNDVEVKDIADVGTGAPLAFPAPVETATSSVLLSSDTLEAWMDAGLVNAPLGQERVVILDAATSTSYGAGHIPGAQFWDISQHVEKRLEGPAQAVNMVVTADRMNELIQTHGIDENTTIVITSSLTATYFPSRTYFLFRYYGWPKDRLKVLDGYNGAWVPAELTTEAPAVEASDLTVQEIANLRHDLRISLPELMDAARDGRGMPVDMRGVKTATGSTAGVYGDVSDDFVVFEGRINGGESFVWKNFNYDYDNGDFRFKSASEIAAALQAAGIDGSEAVYSYCRTGYIASTGFFVLDGILGWPVMTYDGSWSQWGKMSSNVDAGGELPAGSPWAVDNSTYMEVVNYNVNNTVDIEPLNPQADLLDLEPGDAAANQVENEDTTYQQEAGAGDEGGAAGPPTPGDSPAIGC